MIYTSNFAKSKKIKNKRLISISLSTPKWFDGERYSKLAPNWDTIDAWKKSAKTEKDWKNYSRDYTKSILQKLDAKEIIKEFENDDVVFLCYENEKEHCHRLLVADWIFENCGIKIEEI